MKNTGVSGRVLRPLTPFVANEHEASRLGDVSGSREKLLHLLQSSPAGARSAESRAASSTRWV